MKEITAEELQEFEKSFESDRSNLIAKRAVSTNGIYKAAEDMNAVDRNSNENFTFSIDVDSENVANQKRSGRCWIFAALNVLREHLQKEHKVAPDFQLSQSYVYFYDKLEKCNYFYDNMVELADRPLSDALVWHRMDQPQQDGGDWCLVCALIDKYGVVPQDQMNETNCSISSNELNMILNRKLRKDALEIRSLVNEGKADQLEEVRSRMLNEDYRILAIALGVPPSEINFEFKDTSDAKELHQYGPMTPVDFYKQFIGLDLNDFVLLQDIPNVDYNKLYSIEMSGNMVGGRPNLYLNTPAKDMKDAVIQQLKDGYGVWFSCDVMQQFDRQKGVEDLDLYGFNDLFNIDFSMSKKDMYNTKESLPTHGMVIAGVDLRDDKPVRWKIENSWGDELGDKGYMIMSDAWFDEYTYGVAVNKKYLTEEQRQAFETEPTMLPFWDTTNPIMM
ncbi:MAG: C1 family peptidase [Aeriscardovia sp.]|nr:C1 family peptidase [Aeriscardovia sp.]